MKSTPHTCVRHLYGHISRPSSPRHANQDETVQATRSVPSGNHGCETCDPGALSAKPTVNGLHNLYKTRYARSTLPQSQLLSPLSTLIKPTRLQERYWKKGRRVHVLAQNIYEPLGDSILLLGIGMALVVRGHLPAGDPSWPLVRGSIKMAITGQ